MKIYNYIVLFFAVSLFFACEKNGVQTIDMPSMGSGAYVRMSNFAVGGLTVNIYANGTKVSAINSTTGAEAALGLGAYGIFPANNSYAQINSIGDITFTSKTSPNATPTPTANVTTSSLQTNLVAGKYYSYYTSGIFDATARTSSSFIVEDVLPARDTAFAYVRLVNTVPNATNGFNLAAVNTTTNQSITIAQPTAYKAGSTFVQVPSGVYNLTATAVGTPNVVISRTAVSLSKNFVYTLTVRGNANTASTQAIDLTRNR